MEMVNHTPFRAGAKAPITLKTLPRAIAQEVFDQVANHLLTQKERCINADDYSCAYRNSEGLKCAAGCLIADDEYSVYLEGMTWENLVAANKVSKAHMKLISKLQEVHDIRAVNTWYERLKEVAKEYNLAWK